MVLNNIVLNKNVLYNVKKIMNTFFALVKILQFNTQNIIILQRIMNFVYIILY